MTKPVVGFIGTGIMGCSMASHLMAAGFDLHIYNRTQEKATSLIEKGLVIKSSPPTEKPVSMSFSVSLAVRNIIGI